MNQDFTLSYPTQGAKAIVYSVSSVQLLPIKSDDGSDARLIVAEGEVISTGWTNPKLLPYTYTQEPPDGIWDFVFAADPPRDISSPMLTPIRVKHTVTDVPEGFWGVRVHAATNSVETATQ